MSVLLEDLYRDTREQFRLKWIAGSKERHIVNWFYVAEDIGNATFLKGSELIISTGFAFTHDQNWLSSFIKELIKHRTCGLILNIGKYITEADISQEVIDLCNAENYPLLTMPWDVFLTDLTQNYCNRIVADQQREFNLSSAMKSLLIDEVPSPHMLQMLAAHTYFEDDAYTLAVFQVSTAPELLAEVVLELRKRARHCPSAPSTGLILFDYRNQLNIVWRNTPPSTIAKHVNEMLQICHRISYIYDHSVGISDRSSNLTELSKLHDHAIAALRFAKTLPDHLAYYDDLGCYQLLEEIHDRHLLTSFYRRNLGVLEDYDKAHNSMYLETLDAYLRFNGHLGAVAESLICHKNTINYRISKIRDLLNIDLNDGDTRFQLQLSLHIWKYLHL